MLYFCADYIIVNINNKFFYSNSSITSFVYLILLNNKCIATTPKQRILHKTQNLNHQYVTRFIHLHAYLRILNMGFDIDDFIKR